MADYISRDLAIFYFTPQKGRSFPNGITVNPEALVETIKAIPAADVREVVLCKDCKHYYDVMYKGTQFEYGFCDRWCDDTRMRPDDYCSSADMREESDG